MTNTTISRSRTFRVLVVVAIVAAASGAVTATAQHATAPVADDQAEMELSSAEGTAGETVTVRLSLSGEAIAGYQAAVRYDPEVVSFESATGVDFARPQVNDDEDAGVVTLSQASNDAVGTDLVAAELTFRIEAAGSSKLALLDAKSSINNDEMEQLATTVSAGSVTGEDDDGSAAVPPAGSDDGSTAESDDASVQANDDEADASETDGELSTESDDAQRSDEESQSTDEDASSTDAEGDDSTATESEDDELPGFGPAVAVGVLLTVASMAARRR